MGQTTTLDRAYSLLEIRSVDDGERIIEGIASTPTPDRMGDVVDPMGAKFALPMPLLWQHDASQPIGQVVFARPTKAGIAFKARVAKVDEPGALKERLDEAWQSIKVGLVRAVSIGFRAIESSRMESGGRRFLEWEWLELSAVTIPANNEATIDSIKSVDRKLRADLERRTRTAFAAPAAQAAGATLEARRADLLPEILAAYAANDNSLWNELIEADNELAAEIDATRREGLRKNLGLRAPSAQVGLEALMEQRLAGLEAVFRGRVEAMDAAWSRRFEAFQKGAAEALAKLIAKRLDERQEDGDVLRYRGVYQRALAYRKGSLVTDRNAAWTATRDLESGERPGEGDAWQLIIKSPSPPREPAK